jgi:hypothetical protein
LEKKLVEVEKEKQELQDDKTKAREHGTAGKSLSIIIFLCVWIEFI